MRNGWWLALWLLAAVSWAQPEPPRVELQVGASRVEASQPFDATVLVHFAPGLYGYQNPPSKDFMIPVTVSAGEGTELVSVDYPAGVPKIVGGELEPVLVYTGTIRIPVRLMAPGQPGPWRPTLRVRVQQCDEANCFPPTTVEASASVEVFGAAAVVEPSAAPAAPAIAPPPQPAAGSELDPDTPVSSPPAEQPIVDAPATVAPLSAPDVPAAGTGIEPAAAAEASPQQNLVGGGFVSELLRSGYEDNMLALVLVAGLLTGLALCLTPCVFPMIPITVSYFSSQKAESRAGRMGLGAMYALGITLTYGIVGGVFSALGGTVGQLFTFPWFLFALAALMFVLGLSMFGLYEIGIPRPIAKQIKGRTGAVGALVMGLLMGFAAAPCAGALVAGVAIKVSEIGSIPYGVMVFSAIGLGMGLPFMGLAALSQGAKALPKSGSWLITVKAVLGLVVLYIGTDFLFKGLGLRIGEPETLLAWSIVFLVMAAYLLLLERGSETRFAWGLKGAVVLLLGVLVGQSLSERSSVLFQRELAALSGAEATMPNRVQWVKFTEESFEQAKQSGKPIFIDGTADWCAKCQELEREIFNTPAGIRALSTVVAMKIDHSTGVDQEYINWTTEKFQIKGLPVLITLRPGGELVEKSYELRDIEHLREMLRNAGAEL